MLLSLPCGILWNGKHQKEVELEEITGYEEDILANQSKSKTSSPIVEILSRCIARIGEVESPEIKHNSERSQRVKLFAKIMDEMLMVDRSFLFIKLRQISLGDRFEFEVTCPSCKHVHERMAMDLKDLEVVEMLEGGDADIGGESRPVTPRAPKDINSFTTKSGTVLEWRHLKSSDDGFLIQAKKEKLSELLSMTLFRRLISINGEKVKSIGDVKNLTSSDRNDFREEIDKVEGGIDTNVELSCSACSFAWTMELPIMQTSFFFPSGVR